MVCGPPFFAPSRISGLISASRRVGLHVAGVELPEDVDRLRLGFLGDAHAVGQLRGVGVGHALGRVDEDLDDLLGRVVGDGLDVHPAFARAHERDRLRGTIGQHREVVLFLDVGAFLDEEAAHLLAFGAGLMRLQLHAEDLAGVLRDVVQRLGDLDAAALAAPSGMDLRLDDPDRAAEFLGRFRRLADAEGRVTAGHRNAEAGENFLALVFVNLHRRNRCSEKARSTRRDTWRHQADARRIDAECSTRPSAPLTTRARPAG